MTKNSTITPVVENGLCTGCGTCVSLCPTNAIMLTINEKKAIYNPKINEAKCKKCGICRDVCPGHGFDFKNMNIQIFGKEPENILIGNYSKCYVGYSTDYNIRYNSASGGLITQILIFALEEGIIDGALVTRMKENKPLEPEPFIARTKEEVIQSSRSIYCPVPANVALKEILDSNEGERFAVVGLPCHIQGIRKAEQANKKLKNKIILHLGLFCNHSPNFWGTRLFLYRHKIKEDEIIKLNYRGQGYPGSMKILSETGETNILLPNYWNFVGAKFFYPTRCLMCSDGICEFSDISFGDAWLPEYSNEKIGKSIFISQSEIGEQLLGKMKLKNKIEVNEISAKKVIRSQAGMLYFKKKNLNARRRLFKEMPTCNYLLESDSIDYFFALFSVLNSYISSNSYLRIILSHIPSRLIWIYTVSYASVYSRKVKMDFKKQL